MLIPAPTRAGGIDPQLYDRAKAMPGGATIANIVAAGGGNITIAQIVAAGGGNLIGDGGGTLSLIGNAGGTFTTAAGTTFNEAAATVNVPRIGTLQERWSNGNEKAIEVDRGGLLIGKGGAGLIGQDGAGAPQYVGTGAGSPNGINAGNLVAPQRQGFSGTTNPYFRNATRLD